MNIKIQTSSGISVGAATVLTRFFPEYNKSTSFSSLPHGTARKERVNIEQDCVVSQTKNNKIIRVILYNNPRPFQILQNPSIQHL